MTKILLFPKKLSKIEIETKEANEICAFLVQRINELYNFGYSPISILAGLISVTGRCLGKIDPKAERLEGREVVFSLINKYADEEIIRNMEKDK